MRTIFLLLPFFRSLSNGEAAAASISPLSLSLGIIAFGKVKWKLVPTTVVTLCGYFKSVVYFLCLILLNLSNTHFSIQITPENAVASIALSEASASSKPNLICNLHVYNMFEAKFSMSFWWETNMMKCFIPHYLNSFSLSLSRKSFYLQNHSEWSIRPLECRVCLAHILISSIIFILNAKRALFILPRHTDLCHFTFAFYICIHRPFLLYAGISFFLFFVCVLGFRLRSTFGIQAHALSFFHSEIKRDSIVVVEFVCYVFK